MPVQDREDQQGRVGPFVTFVSGCGPTASSPAGNPATIASIRAPAVIGSTWWAPRARGWWIAVLFAIGSLLFALGTVPAYASAVGAGWDVVTFFVGSLFFTAAGFLTYCEAVDAGPARRAPAHAGLCPSTFLRLPAPPDRLVVHSGATGRDRVLQRQHRGLDGLRPVRAGRAPARVAARRGGLGLLPGRQRAGLVRGLPRLGCLASPVLVLVDHPGRPGRGPSPSACPPWPATSARPPARSTTPS